MAYFRDECRPQVGVFEGRPEWGRALRRLFKEGARLEELILHRCDLAVVDICSEHSRVAVVGKSIFAHMFETMMGELKKAKAPEQDWEFINPPRVFHPCRLRKY